MKAFHHLCRVLNSRLLPPAIRIAGLFLILGTTAAFRQYLDVDQHAGTDAGLGHSFCGIEANTPIGQIFTPSSNAVGFVQIGIGGGGPARLHINLRAESITGLLIAQSRSVTVPRDYRGVVFFGFKTNMPVLPGKVYCFEVESESGSDCAVAIYHFACPNGRAVLNGITASNVWNMWFREGMVSEFPRLSVPSLQPQNLAHLQFMVLGTPGHEVVTERSTDLLTWIPIQTNVFTEATLSLVFSNESLGQFFYRTSHSFAENGGTD